MQAKKIWPKVGDIVKFKTDFQDQTGMLWYKWQDGCGTKDLAASILVGWEQTVQQFFLGKKRFSVTRTYNFLHRRFFAVQFVRAGTQADLPVSIEELLLDPEPRVQLGAKRLLKLWDKQERLKNQVVPKEVT